MSIIYNCPNCGAPIGYSEICPYCGTRLRWEPQVSVVEFKPINERRHTIAARVDIPDSSSVSEDKIRKELERQLSELLHEYWTIYKDYDFRNFKKCYTATIDILK